MNIKRELADIKNLIVSAHIIEMVKKEVKIALNGKKAMVVGSHYVRDIINAGNYDLIIKHQSGIEASELISRRILEKIPTAKIEKLCSNIVASSLVDNVIGIKHSCNRI